MNMKAEVIALWSLFWFSIFWNIPTIYIFGNSCIVIENGTCTWQQQNTTAYVTWMALLDRESLVNIYHIGWEYKHNVDNMSKFGLWDAPGGMHIEINMGANRVDTGTLPLPV